MNPWPDCSECRAFLDSNPHLIGAAASVGIEHGKSTSQVIMEYLQVYHMRGHQEKST